MQLQAMTKKAFSTVTDQVTDSLRLGMLEGRWLRTSPGRK